MPSRIHDIAWARKLKLRHLEVFLVLCDARSITAAAIELHMTQPAVSHWLADIEALIEAPLFIRGRQLKTTAAGEILRRHAERMLGDVRRTGEDLVAVTRGLAGTLRIGSITSGAAHLIPGAVARLHADYPDLHVEVFFDATFKTSLERLRKRELDLVLGPLDIRAQQSGFCCERLTPESVALVISPGHPFARKRDPSWHEAAAFPWIMPPTGTITRRVVNEAFVEAGIPVPPARVETASHVLIQMMLQQGTYMSALVASAAEVYARFSLLDIVHLSPPIMFGDIGMLWDTHDPDPRLERLLAAMREQKSEAR